MENPYANLTAGEGNFAGSFFESRNPAHWSEVIGSFPRSSAADVDRAVVNARRAFGAWRLTPAPRRAEILFRAAELLKSRKEEFARHMTREMGKVLAEARGDVQEGVDMLYYVAGEGRRLFGETTPSELAGKFAMSVRAPVGVVAAITPWNFPLAIPSWKLAPALVAGNTVIFKPAEDTPLIGHLFAELLLEAGVPPGVLNVVHGDGETGAALVSHPEVDLVSFTGSTEVGREVAHACVEGFKRVSLEMGGKNAILVMDDADLPLAVDGAVWGAFGTSGQRCTASSRLIVHESVHDRFVEMLVERTRSLALGDGLDENVQIGPVINEVQLQRVESYVEIGRSEGACVACGGGRAHGTGDGWFFTPTVFTGVSPGMRVAQEEIFGPVTCVVPVSSLEEGISVANGVKYGLSSAIYTADVNGAFRAMRDLDSGIVYVNASTIGAEVHLPFGGVRQTGNGHREGGHALDVFTEWKALYVDYSGTLQRAQIDNQL